MRMSNRAAAHDSVVFKEENLLIFARSQKIFPMFNAHMNHAAHFFFGIGWHIDFALAPLNQNELVCALDDIVLIFKENNIVVSVNDVS